MTISSDDGQKLVTKSRFSFVSNISDNNFMSLTKWKNPAASRGTEVVKGKKRHASCYTKPVGDQFCYRGPWYTCLIKNHCRQYHLTCQTSLLIQQPTETSMNWTSNIKCGGTPSWSNGALPSMLNHRPATVVKADKARPIKQLACLVGVKSKYGQGWWNMLCWERCGNETVCAMWRNSL